MAEASPARRWRSGAENAALGPLSVEARLQVQPGGVAHRGQLALIEIAGEADPHLAALERIGIAVEPKYGAGRPVRYREMRRIEIEIGFRIFHLATTPVIAASAVRRQATASAGFRGRPARGRPSCS